MTTEKSAAVSAKPLVAISTVASRRRALALGARRDFRQLRGVRNVRRTCTAALCDCGCGCEFAGDALRAPPPSASLLIIYSLFAPLFLNVRPYTKCRTNMNVFLCIKVFSKVICLTYIPTYSGKKREPDLLSLSN